MMELIKKLENWIVTNNLSAEFLDERVFKIGDKSFFLIPEKRQERSNQESIFTDEFDLNVSFPDEEFAEEIKVGNYCFYFGNNFYYTPIDSIEDPQLNILKYIGSAKTELDNDYSFLGVRGPFELCNGSGTYDDWASKAKFMGVKSLGLSEHNTLAGTLLFQRSCKEVGIKPILGETITVRNANFSEYQVKCYVKNQSGWFNLLYINKIINVDNVGSQLIDEKHLLRYGKGLIIVLDSEFPLSKSRLSAYKREFDQVFYQLDLTEFNGQEKDMQRLLANKKYIDNFINDIHPVLIQDAFYLDPEYSHVKKILNTSGNVRFQYESKDQWFKNLDEIFYQWALLFKDGDNRIYHLFENSIKNTMVISDSCNYEIETGVRHLPDYEHNGEESNEDLFLRKVVEGMTTRGLDGKQEYWDRIEKEISVIKKGEVIDYFLILWDIVDWCKSQDIIVGVGRGSAAGSLVSYVLGITGLDPIEYGLLFERFLNEGRVKTSLPDIDLDFPGQRREEVKRYMEEKYGIDYVCSVGTYGTFQLRSSIKDVGKQFGMSIQQGNYIVSKIGTNKGYEKGRFVDLFGEANEFPPLKSYIKGKPHVVDTLRIILKQPKNASVHACATLILPKKDQNGLPRNIYNWIPVKSVDGILVSEWEGEQLEEAGFLKEDILGIKQLDKFKDVFDRVKDNRGIVLGMDSVDLKDDSIYDLFRRGISSDVFHFGTRGLTAYAKEVKPTNIEDMIAIMSLYRPGPIESHTHTDFVKLKYGEKQIEYDYMLKEITKETYGLFIYQEQVMMAVVTLGGFSLVTADDIRKAMGKKKMSLIREYKAQFIEGAVARKCNAIDAESIWNKLEAFAKYGFNRSHAAAYSYTGMMCQWLKVKYPLEFWTTTMEFADDKNISSYVLETVKLDNGVNIVPPDINKSETRFISDPKTGNIYWAINKIMWVGDSATECIINERNENGHFLSVKDFYGRVNTTKVNKRVIENLILAGCFDELYSVDKSQLFKRHEILEEYYSVAKTKDDSRFGFITSSDNNNWYWTAKQKELSGLGHFDFNDIIMHSKLKSMITSYMDPVQLQDKSSLGKRTIVAGIIKEKFIKQTKKGDEFCSLVIDVNDEEVHFLLWPDAWENYKEKVLESKTGLFIGTATVFEDMQYKKCNVLKSDSSTRVQMM